MALVIHLIFVTRGVSNVSTGMVVKEIVFVLMEPIKSTKTEFSQNVLHVILIANNVLMQLIYALAVLI